MESSPEPQPAGGTEYAAYLLIDDLLELQRPLTEGAHDELLFIIVHQAYELWFKLMLHELAKVDAELRADRPGGALASLKRVVAIDRLLLAKLDVLETMGPEGFLEFRSPLEPASGFQSRQFREIERATAESVAGVLRRLRAGGERSRRTRRPLPRPRRAGARAPPPGLRAARRPRRDDPALALPPHADGGARDRLATRHRRVARCRVPAWHR